jgi:hypothetical protein
MRARDYLAEGFSLDQLCNIPPFDVQQILQAGQQMCISPRCYERLYPTVTLGQ